MRDLTLQAVGTLALAAAYWAAATVGLSLAFSVQQVSAVWPSSGIALASLLLLGARFWPGILIGAFLANAAAHEPLATALGIACGNTMEAVVGAWLLRRFLGFSCALDRIRDVLSLVLAAVASATLAATVGSASLCLGELHSWADYGRLWTLWWLGDGIGALIVAPAILAWVRATGPPWTGARTAEAGALVVALILVCRAVFLAPLFPGSAVHALGYGVFPIVTWAALRFRQPLTTAAILISSALALDGTVRGLGPFAEGPVDERVVLVQVFMALVAVTGLFLAASASERDTTERRRVADHAVTQVLSETDSLSAVAPRILRAVGESLDWDVGAVWMVDAPAGSLRCLEFWRKDGVSVPAFEAATRERTFGLASGLPGRVWAAAAPLWLPDLATDPSFVRAPVAAQEGLHAAFAFPVVLGSQVYGVLEFLSHQVRVPEQGLLETFRVMGVQIGQFIERRRAEDERANLLLSEQAARSQAEAAVARLTRVEAELREASEAKDRFLAVLGHELRNPLSAVRNALEVTTRMHAVIDRQAGQLTRLVDDLLDVARISQGKIGLRREAVDLVPLARRAGEAVRGTAAERGHELVLSLPEGRIPVKGDPARLEQVVANLLSNAVKYSPRPGRIRLAVRRDGPQAVLCVEDDGIGIRPELLDSIFSPFVQADHDPGRVQDGLGVGLTLVRNLVEMHGGTVAASSGGLGKGSVFTVRLPLLREAPRPQPALRTGPEPAASGPGRRILVVDDNLDVAESLAILLAQSGHHVSVAHDGPSALERARDERPEAVLLDIGLPGAMDGYEVARRFRADPELNKAYLVAVTGFGQEEDRERASVAGFDRHVVKPVDPAQLQRLLSGL